MKLKPNASFLFFVTLVVVAILNASIARADEIALSACPPVVQETIRKELKGGTLDEVKHLSIEGRSLYIAQVELSGDRDLRIHVGSDGRLLKTREEITLLEAPVAVQETVKRLQPTGSRIDDVDREVTDAKTTYRIEIDRPQARDINLHLAEDGTVISQSEDS